MTEVISLTPLKSEELASLLEYTSLSSIISTSKIITDRLKFIVGFEEIVFDVELKKSIKERSQLHKILSDNAWFFGDEYFVSVNDQSRTEVLKKHMSYLNKDIILDIDIESPVLRLDGKIGDEYAKLKANQQNYNKGTIFQSNENNIIITIKVKTWSEIIAENKHRYNFVKTHLDLSISNADGLRYLQEKYSNYVGENKHDTSKEDG
jgi:hypothetical protein